MAQICDSRYFWSCVLAGCTAQRTSGGSAVRSLGLAVRSDGGVNGANKGVAVPHGHFSRLVSQKLVALR